MCAKISSVHPLPEIFYALVMEREAVSLQKSEMGCYPHPLHLVMDETLLQLVS